MSQQVSYRDWDVTDGLNDGGTDSICRFLIVNCNPRSTKIAAHFRRRYSLLALLSEVIAQCINLSASFDLSEVSTATPLTSCAIEGGSDLSISASAAPSTTDGFGICNAPTSLNFWMTRENHGVLYLRAYFRTKPWTHVVNECAYSPKMHHCQINVWV